MLASASLNLIIHTWSQDVLETDVVYTPNVPSKITNVCWCNDNNYLAILCSKGKPEILATRDKNNIKLIHTITPINDVTALTFQHTTKRCLGLGTCGGQVALYDTKSRAISKLFQSVPASVKAIDFNATDNCLAVACENGFIPIYDMDEGNIIGNYKLPGGSHPTAMRFHVEDAKLLAVASDGGEIVLWDIAIAKKVFFAQSHTSAVTGLAMTPCAKTMVTVGEDYKMCVYDMNISECVYRNSVQQPITAVDMNYDGKTIAVGFKDGNISIYDTRFLIQPNHTITSHNSEINKLCFENKLPDVFGLQCDTVSEISFRSKNASYADSSNSKRSGSPKHDQNNSKEVTNKKIDEEKVCNETVVFHDFRKEIMKQLHYYLNDLTYQLHEHVTKFREFIDTEFSSLNNIIDDKWDIENIVGLKEENNEISDED